MDRRTFCAAAAASLAAACAARDRAAGGDDKWRTRFESVRAKMGKGGRLGVAAIEIGTDRRLLFDADSRYAMCSTFKAPLAAAVLAKADTGAISLDDEILFEEADLLDHAPVVRANFRPGRRSMLSLRTLCAAAVEVSDNSAANLLLPEIGGPAGLTRFLRSVGDRVTRLDRDEPSLNSNIPGDPRDTTSPAAMAALMGTLLFGNRLSAGARDQLAAWLEGATTGMDRLRAGLPADWIAGHKTGTGNGANNDVAVGWRPAGPPLVIASFSTGGDAPAAERNAVHREVARIVAEAFA